jgi:hypothetical protein
LLRYEDSLEVTEVEPLVAYVMSMISLGKGFTQQEVTAFREYVEEKMRVHGVINIRKSPCLFVARKRVRKST